MNVLVDGALPGVVAVGEVNSDSVNPALSRGKGTMSVVRLKALGVRTAKRRGGPFAMLGAVLAVGLVVMGLAPLPRSHAATGEKQTDGVAFAGFLRVNNNGVCTVTVVSHWLAITAKHCGTVNPFLKLDVASGFTPGHDYAIKKIVQNPQLDVEAIFLTESTDLPVSLVSSDIAYLAFNVWGYGSDVSNTSDLQLRDAHFGVTKTCSGTSDSGASGELCWPTDAQNSVCFGDSGGPVTVDGVIIGMVTGGDSSSQDCGTVIAGRALTVRQMQPWLDEMAREAEPSGSRNDGPPVSGSRNDGPPVAGSPSVPAASTPARW
jgi:hypothetical protein